MILFRIETHKLAVRAILANKVRSFLTMLGVIIGVASVILLVSIGTGLQNYIQKQFEDLGSNLLFVVPGTGGFGGDPSARYTRNKISDKELDNLNKFGSDFLLASPELTFFQTAKRGGESKNYSVSGVDENYFALLNYKVASGQEISKTEISNFSKVAVIGQTVVKELFKGASPLGQEITLGSHKLTVVGTYESKGSIGGTDRDAALYIPYTTAKKFYDVDKLSGINIKILSSDNKEINKRKVTAILLKTLKKDDFSVLSQDELLNTIQGILGTLTAALGGIAAISLLVGGIGIMNIMLVSVTERTREIGLRKAVGAKFSDILLQFLIEAIALSSVGGVVGIILGSLGSYGLGKFLSTSVTWWSVIIAFGFSAFVGIAFGTWPAYKAAKKDPIEALRYE